MRPTIAMAALLLAGASISAPAPAVTQQPFTVSADIVNGCAVTPAGSGNWGDIDLGTVAGATTGTVEADLLSSSATGIQIDCTPGMSVTLSADNGNQPSAGVRRLAIGGDLTTPIPYLLFVNGTTPWTSQSVALSFPAGTSHQTFPVHARATLSGATKAGTYRDTVRVTLSW